MKLIEMEKALQKAYREYISAVEIYEVVDEAFMDNMMDEDLEAVWEDASNHLRGCTEVLLEKLGKMVRINDRGTLIRMIESVEFKKLMACKVV